MSLSIIVCTRNRSYAIMDCLESIRVALEKAAPIEAEIVVIDNASTDDTSDVVRGWAGTCAFPVRLMLEPRKGLSAARNCGLRVAVGSLVAFTDDDCRLSPDYVTELRAHDEADTELILRGGRVELGDPTDLPFSIKTDLAAARWTRALRSAKSRNIIASIVGCNMTARRTLFEKIGRFDEKFGVGSAIPGGEDTDYIFRAYLAGMLIEYVPDMIVYHHHGRKSPEQVKKLFSSYMVGLGAIYAKFLFKDPDLCRTLAWDIKKTAKEIITRKNGLMPEIGFSYKGLMMCHFQGVTRYFMSFF